MSKISEERRNEIVERATSKNPIFCQRCGFPCHMKDTKSSFPIEELKDFLKTQAEIEGNNCYGDCFCIVLDKIAELEGNEKAK